MGNAPRPGEGDHDAGPSWADQRHVGRRGIGRSRHDDAHLRPGRTSNAHQPPAAPWGWRVIRGRGVPAHERALARQTVMAPVAHDHHARQANDRGALGRPAPLRGPRRLLSRRAFHRAIPHQSTHASIRGGQGRDDLIRKPPDQEPRMPRPRGQQPAQMPLRPMARGQPRQPFDRGLLLVNRLAHQPPAADERMAMAEQRPQHVQPIRYGCGQTRALAHGGSPRSRGLRASYPRGTPEESLRPDSSGRSRPWKSEQTKDARVPRPRTCRFQVTSAAPSEIW